MWQLQGILFGRNMPDLTGTNDYSVVFVTRNTEEECESEFWAQLSDGYFECSATGAIVELTPDSPLWNLQHTKLE